MTDRAWKSLERHLAEQRESWDRVIERLDEIQSRDIPFSERLEEARREIRLG